MTLNPCHLSAKGPIAESASDIVFGRLPPGKKLKLDTLKADYGPSVSTLREILNRLSSERLVVAEGQKGFEVALGFHRKLARDRRAASAA